MSYEKDFDSCDEIYFVSLPKPNNLVRYKIVLSNNNALSATLITDESLALDDIQVSLNNKAKELDLDNSMF